ncbi:MAG: FHA domain-containing protein [Planctomycetota bacterium]|nr:FHA domain-containing protein [Planctomycetota bacterium]
MTQQATITFTSGPDRGKMFPIEGDMVNIGHGDENEVTLADSSLSEHHASIAVHNGQFVIYSPIDEGVEVDGKIIPPERWVKLPTPARIRFGERTACQFNFAEINEESALPATMSAKTATGAPPPPAVKKKRPNSGNKRSAAKSATTDGTENKKSDKGKRPKPSNRKTARFITDQVGDAKVSLGDDGTLPELVLAEANTRRVQERQAKQSNPAVLYIAVAISFLMSIGLMFVDAEPAAGRSETELNKARNAAREFYRESGTGELKRYQKLLRQAAMAHSRRDRVAEVNAYREVLNLLNSEDNDRSFLGLTGDRESDEQLRDHVSILVGK